MLRVWIELGLFKVLSVENKTPNGTWVVDPVRQGLFLFNDDGSYYLINASQSLEVAHTGKFELLGEALIFHIDRCSITTLNGSKQFRPIERFDGESLVFSGVGSSGSPSRVHLVKV